jgi:hypothetical protein
LNKLNNAVKDKKKSQSLIENFPVPNTKEDLLEFIIAATSRLGVCYKHNDVSSGLVKAWEVKLNDAYQKAELVFSSDKASMGKAEELFTESQKTKKQVQTKLATQKTIKVVVPIVIVIGLITGGYFLFRNTAEKETNQMNKIVQEVNADITKGKADSALKRLKKLVWDYKTDDPDFADEVATWDAKRAELQASVDSLYISEETNRLQALQSQIDGAVQNQDYDKAVKLAQNYTWQYKPDDAEFAEEVTEWNQKRINLIGSIWISRITAANPYNQFKEEKKYKKFQSAKPGLGDVPEEYRTATVCLAALKEAKSNSTDIILGNQKGSSIADVPANVQTPEFWAQAVAIDPGILASMPANLKTPDMMIQVVSADGSALKNVPDSMRTQAVCEAAVKKTGSALQYVPEKFVTSALCQTAVSNSWFALQYVPDRLKTSAMCLTAVKRYGDALEYVPANLITEDMCMAAAIGSYQGLKFVPDRFKTVDMCVQAVKAASVNSKYTLDYVPAGIINEVKQKAGIK